VGEDLLARGLKATELIKPLAAEIKGGGGGQPFYATAGGKDPGGLERALGKVKDLVG
jgi:alanyl-tRNA synthetase